VLVLGLAFIRSFVAGKGRDVLSHVLVVYMVLLDVLHTSGGNFVATTTLAPYGSFPQVEGRIGFSWLQRDGHSVYIVPVILLDLHMTYLQKVGASRVAVTRWVY